MTIAERPEWHRVVAAERLDPERWAAMKDLGTLVQPSDVETLIGLIRDAPQRASTVAHAALHHAFDECQLVLSREQLDGWATAVLDRHADVFANCQSEFCDVTLSAVYGVISSLFEGAPYALLVERLGEPTTVDHGIPGERGASCHYTTDGLEVYLEADVEGRLVAWSETCGSPGPS